MRILTTMSNSDHSQHMESCHLALFIAGNGPNSQIARKNLAQIRDQDLGGRCTMEIIDILVDFAAAVKHDILVTPTLLITSTQNVTMVVGNLSDREKVRAALRISVVEA